LKAVIISKYFRPEYDGVGDHSYKLTKYLKEYGLRFDIITSSVKSNKEDLHNNQLYSVIDAIKLCFLLHRLKPDVIILQYVGYSFHAIGFPYWLIIVMKVFKLRKTKIVSIVHETYIRPGLFLRTKIISYLQRICLKYLLHNSNIAFTSIERYLNQCKHYQTNTHLLRIGSNIEPNVTTKDKLSTSKKPYLVIWGDRNHSKSLNIFKTFKNHFLSDIELKIIGKLSPDNIQEIKIFLDNNTKINQYISLIGVLKEDELSKILDESLGIIMLENLEGEEGGFTLKSGVSIAAIRHQMLIFTNKGDMTDSFLKHQEHVIFLSESLKESAQTIHDSIKNKALVNAIKLNLQEIEKAFKWEIIAKSIYEHLQ
jgi:hypothetical protein